MAMTRRNASRFREHDVRLIKFPLPCAKTERRGGGGVNERERERETETERD